MKINKKCFVLMPFSTTKSCAEEEWTGIFKGLIKPAVEESGLSYECERSVAERQNIIKSILESLNIANVVIADLTDNNPNVFYELGVRHTLKNRTILIAQGKEHVPFDLMPYPVAFYNKNLSNIEEFKSDIKNKLHDIEKNPERLDNPVADFLRYRNIVLLSSEKKRNLAKLTALLSELSYNLDSVEELLASVKRSEERRKEKGGVISSRRLDNTCLELLLSTSYITLSQQLLEMLKEIYAQTRIINNTLDVWSQDRFAKSVEKRLKEKLPEFKKSLVSAFPIMDEVRIDYNNDNYLEPKTPIILLSSPEHQEFLKTT